ncbi:DUF1178 family protein [Ideonella sp.]|uniref:DUF1178 family protein n=1 Tax=Ideonella sp. TaxID=1929293 RepID=UPI0035B3A375
MKVLDLRCAHGHAFEGWFASERDFASQQEHQMVACPLCADTAVTRLPSAPRLNLGASAPAQQPTGPATHGAARDDMPGGEGAVAMQQLWLQAVRHVMSRTEDVGERFTEEARRIHYGEAPSRGIRGQATAEQRAALADEGIETVALPVPPGLDGPAH